MLKDVGTDFYYALLYYGLVTYLNLHKLEGEIYCKIYKIRDNLHCHYKNITSIEVKFRKRVEFTNTPTKLERYKEMLKCTISSVQGRQRSCLVMFALPGASW